MADSSTNRDTAHRAVINEAGRVVVPAPLRTQLGIRPGDSLLFEVLEGRLVATPLGTVLGQARAAVRGAALTGRDSATARLSGFRRARG